MKRSMRDPTIRGVATVELAVCLPVVVLLVVATIEACSMVFLKQTLSVAAYQGVRAATSAGAMPGDIQATCQQIFRDRGVRGGSVQIRPANFHRLSPGEYVNVIVSAPCAPNSIVRNTFYQGRTLSAEASMMIEFRPSR